MKSNLQNWELKDGEYKMHEGIKTSIIDSIKLKKAILEDFLFLSNIEEVISMLTSMYEGGNKLILAGNGGSAADAQHIAAEIVGRFLIDRPGLPAIALTTDTSIITAIGNDFGYKSIFSRQVEAIGRKGDMILLISTSGNSENLIECIEICKEKQIKTILLSGHTGGKLKKLCDYSILIPSSDTPRIQEVHILIGHIIVNQIEQQLCMKGVGQWKQSF